MQVSIDTKTSEWKDYIKVEKSRQIRANESRIPWKRVRETPELGAIAIQDSEKEELEPHSHVDDVCHHACCRKLTPKQETLEKVGKRLAMYSLCAEEKSVGICPKQFPLSHASRTGRIENLNVVRIRVFAG